ncbi:MAG: hypothetical protein SAJ72_20705 [Jaaginema sp. PMC 1080.18]|nr:hypothetical protein [Jaaginema sp. PMC 1080.18]
MPDDIGLWINLGIVKPRPDIWQKFIKQATWGNKTFRVSVTTPYPEDVRGWVWIRQVIQPTGDVTPSVRYYPKPETQLIELPPPPEIQDRTSLVIRAIEVKRSRTRWNGYSKTRQLPLLAIKLEELAGV